MTSKSDRQEEGRGVRRIPLTRGKSAIVDAADVELVSARYWRAACYNGKWLAVSGHSLRLHRLLLDAPPGIPVAFVNGDTLDCRRSNLCLRRDLERGLRHERYIGVRRLASGRYSARLWHDRRKVYLGTYQTARDAALAVNVGWRLLRGCDARSGDLPPNSIPFAATTADLIESVQRLDADRAATPQGRKSGATVDHNTTTDDGSGAAHPGIGPKETSCDTCY